MEILNLKSELIKTYGTKSPSRKGVLHFEEKESVKIMSKRMLNWLLLGGGAFFGWWWVVVDVFWLVVGSGGYILAGGWWWWVVVNVGE